MAKKKKLEDTSLEELEAGIKKMDAIIEKEKVKMKSEGFTHLVEAWIHPEHGDDRQVAEYYRGEPTSGDIKRLLKRSVVKTDYRIIKL